MSLRRLALAVLPLLTALPCLAAGEGSGGWPEWRAVFKTIHVTTHAGVGEAGFARDGDDSRGTNELSLRLQLSGAPLDFLAWRVDYLNVNRHLPAPPLGAPAAGAALYRRKPLREYLERPETAAGQPPSTQTVEWYHELDRAYLRLDAGPLEARLGRFPITWGAGRIWQPTDLFAAFAPTEIDTEYKAGVDGASLAAFLSPFSSLTAAHVLSPASQPEIGPSTVLRFRSTVGEESELTVVGGSVREEELLGGSIETVWLRAGWRLEGIFFRPRNAPEETEPYLIAGLDFQLDDATVIVLEYYRHGLGGDTEAELPAVAASLPLLEGRLQHLSRSVLGLAASNELGGLWRFGYTLLGSAVRDDAGSRRPSLLHQLVLTYSISDDAQADFSLLGGSGKGLDAAGAPRSEFGHVPDTLFVRIQFVL
jgi:hypothetical protein